MKNRNLAAVGKYFISITTFFLLSITQIAQAHTSFVVTESSKAFAAKSYYGTLNLGHGCTDLVSGAHFDTEKLEVDIPPTATSVRPVDAEWATAAVVKDQTTPTIITRLVWTKTGPVQLEDSHLYRVSFTVKLPDAPLTTLAFPARQICHNSEGVEITTPWEGLEAPTLKLLPARVPGWNKYTTQIEINTATIQSFFSDAQIVWSGASAYSANPVTDGLISNKLTVIPAGAEYWVKY